MNASPAKRLRILAVRPEPAEQPGGDEVVYRKTLPLLRASMEVDELHLHSIGKIARYARILQLNPPECTRFISNDNRQRVQDALRKESYDAVLLCNEVSFPMRAVTRTVGVPTVLAAHNLQSVVARDDPSWLGRMMRPLAIAFERRWYADPGIELVLISEVDRDGLKAAGVHREDISVAPPGAPPGAGLSSGAKLLPEAVLTGSYSWWRKRRDLADFAHHAAFGFPISVTDPTAAEILGSEGRLIAADGEPAWADGIRFGLVLDRFVGGFKLKSLEYVARNCIVLSLSDIRPDFAGLPHATEFVRFLPDKTAMSETMRTMLQTADPELPARFKAFKEACLARFEWQQSSLPLIEAVRRAASRNQKVTP